MAADHHNLRGRASGGLLTLLALLAGCAGTREEPVASAPAPTVPPPPAVTAVRNENGVTWLELSPSTSWEPGTVLRIGDAQDPERIKALAVVMDRAADGSAQARLTGLSDRASPVLAGDPLRSAPPEPAEPAAAPAAGDPVLERLGAERDALRAAVRERDLDLGSSDAALAAVRDDLVRLRRSGGGAAGATLDPAGRSRLAADLARVEAERAYFELASRVLRLDADPKALAALQDTVRRALEARADLADGRDGGKPQGGHHE
ncbi:MAG: hypothetical protein L6R48_15575 [Planctomycetes bacterium]|nr:hypothetical protein [Planctomycetota bacterium]